MYKQSKADRMDESLGMRNGPARDKMQDYRSRRDESKGMSMSMAKKHNQSYLGKEMGEMGHEKKPMMIKPKC